MSFEHCSAWTTLSTTHADVATVAVGDVSVDGSTCTGSGSLTVLSSAAARDPSQLKALGLTDISARVQRNQAANATLNGGFDQAIMRVGFFGGATTCGSFTFGADAILFYISTEGATQDITITTADGVSDTTQIPEKSNAIFLVDGGSLCIHQEAGVRQARQIDSVVLPDGTPGSTASIFDETMPITFNKDLPVANETAGNAACFPASALVEVAGGYKVPMSMLTVGDSVRTGVDTFSEVMMFTHRESTSLNEFVSLSTDNGHVISLSATHYLHVTALGHLVPAHQIKTGDALFIGETGLSTLVVNTEVVWKQGLYNPQTIDGNIVVDGIVASAYTTAIHPLLAHFALLAPVRWLYKLPFSTTRSLLGSVFASGNPLAAFLLPSGPPVVAL
jgi:desert hedgehog